MSKVERIRTHETPSARNTVGNPNAERPVNSQPTENKGDTAKFEDDALQDLLISQPVVLLGLIANFTGLALQDDIVKTVRRMQQLGLDIEKREKPMPRTGMDKPLSLGQILKMAGEGAS